MESYVKATNNKRFVVEDSITKVTSDGEPHEMMTIIAGLSGLVVAIVILAILVSLVSCKKKSSKNQCKNCISAVHLNDIGAMDSKRSSLSTVCTRSTSIAESAKTDSQSSRHVSIAVVYSGNLKGNLNSAFVDSESNLGESLYKPKKKTHWSDEMEHEATQNAKITTISLERY